MYSKRRVKVTFDAVGNPVILRADGDYSKRDYTDVHVYECDANQLDIVIDKGKKVSDIATKEGADAAINFPLFYKGAPIGFVVKNGKLLNDTVSAERFSDFIITKDGKSKVSQLVRGQWDDIKLAFTGTPQLVRDGKIYITDWAEKTPQDIKTGRAPRTAIGIRKDRKILLVVVDGRTKFDTGLRLDELAAVMVDLDCIEAINGDGGGSSAMWLRSEGAVVNNPSDGSERATGAAVIVRKKAEQQPDFLLSRIKNYSPNKRIWALDRGHGIETPGKRSPDGTLREWEFNKDVRRRLAEYLDINGIPYIFTVTDQSDMPLRERTDIENQLVKQGYKTAFLSIHANAFGSGGWNDARGIETYSYPEARESKSMSKIFLNYLLKETGLLNRGVKEADFHVLRETKGDAVLTENGFMTNKEEAELLKSDEYREKVARAHAKAICEIDGMEFKDLGEANPPKQLDKSTIYRVQVGAFTEYENAVQLQKKLKLLGYDSIIQRGGEMNEQ